MSWPHPLFTDHHQRTLLDVGLLVLRLGFGGIMAFAHGLAKITHFNEIVPQFISFLGLSPTISLALAISAEFFCSILIMIGLATRLAAIPLIVTMCVAGFFVHAADPFNVKELAFLYLLVFVTMLLTGAGRFSIDGWLVRRAR